METTFIQIDAKCVRYQGAQASGGTETVIYTRLPDKQQKKGAQIIDFEAYRLKEAIEPELEQALEEQEPVEKTHTIHKRLFMALDLLATGAILFFIAIMLVQFIKF